MKIPTPTPSAYAGLYPADVRARCGFKQPSAELDLPMRVLDDADGMMFKRLEGWFREHTGDHVDAMVCYIASRYGVMLDTAETLRDEFEANYDGGYN
ncbi:MAG: hypothetical protein GX970_05435 [Phyllobacteriaceae bacterium]|nr:hypothetical protein [Phyllobacteriaceae bacterium]